MSRDVLVIGGGMITRDQILPSLLYLKCTGKVKSIEVCATRQSTLDALPGIGFATYAGDYRLRVERLPERSIVFIATPDHLHQEMVMTALAANQNVICVKPLALKLAHAQEIESEARKRDLFVGVEYHKRFDDRSGMAQNSYREGQFGEFRLGHAWLLEKEYYKHSNFQNWFTCDNSDAFTYIGCHYVDLVAFITGLRPTAVSLHGIKDRFPNGNEGYLWTDARVHWSNGACLNVQNALGFPNHAPGSNSQGLTMYCDKGWIDHQDQYRGVKHAFADRAFSEPSPDYFQMIGAKGHERPVGYGFRSIEALVDACENRPCEFIATPANSSYNEAVIEAARESLRQNGATIPVASSD